MIPVSRSLERARVWAGRPRRIKQQLRAVAAALLIVTAYILWRYDGQPRLYRLTYFLPAVIMGVLFLFDRLPRAVWLGRALLLLDLLIIVAALYRAIEPIFFYSGHALVTTYVLLTVRSRTCFVVTLLVLLQTIWLKLIVWSPDLSLAGGLILGSLLGIGHRLALYRRYRIL